MRSFLIAVTLALTGCNCTPPTMDDGGVDAGAEVDAGRPDASVDAGADDAGLDAGEDAGLPDAGVDAGPGDGGCSYRLDPAGGWTTSRPLALEVADLNGDGHLDLVVATTSTLEVRLNDGDAGFGSTSLVGPIAPQTLVVTDLDADGRLDVAAIDVAGRLVVLTGNGDGTFAAPLTLDAGPVLAAPVDTALADLDLDGRLDFVTLDVGGTVPELRVVRGTFDGGAARVTTGSHRLVLTDVTGDGLVDALAGNSQYGLSLHAGDGDAGFGAPRVFLGSTSVNAFVHADVTGDGVADAVCATGYFDGTLTNGGGVAVLTGADGGFTEPQVSPGGRFIMWTLGLADLNRDGVLDVVTTRLAPDAGLEVLSGDDAGGFTPLIRVAGRNGLALAVSDLNADGWPDVALGMGSGSTGEVRVLLGSCQ